MSFDEPQNLCFVFAVEDDYLGRFGYLHIQFGCPEDEGFTPERWQATSLSHASRFTSEGVEARISCPRRPERGHMWPGFIIGQLLDDVEDFRLVPIYVPQWDINQTQML